MAGEQQSKPGQTGASFGSAWGLWLQRVGSPPARLSVTGWKEQKDLKGLFMGFVALRSCWLQKQLALRQGHPTGCSAQSALGAEVSSESNPG